MLYASKVVRGESELRLESRKYRTVCRAGVAVVAILATCLGTAQGSDKKKRAPDATVSYSPMPLDSGYGPMDITEPPISPDEIIKKFTAKETDFREALNHYTYRRTVRVQTIDDNNKVDGEYYEVDDVIFTPDGRRTEKVVFAPANSLQRIAMS